MQKIKNKVERGESQSRSRLLSTHSLHPLNQCKLTLPTWVDGDMPDMDHEYSLEINDVGDSQESIDDVPVPNAPTLASKSAPPAENTSAPVTSTPAKQSHSLSLIEALREAQRKDQLAGKAGSPAGKHTAFVEIIKPASTKKTVLTQHQRVAAMRGNRLHPHLTLTLRRRRRSNAHSSQVCTPQPTLSRHLWTTATRRRTRRTMPRCLLSQATGLRSTMVSRKEASVIVCANVPIALAAHPAQSTTVRSSPDHLLRARTCPCRPQTRLPRAY